MPDTFEAFVVSVYEGTSTGLVYTLRFTDRGERIEARYTPLTTADVARLQSALGQLVTVRVVFDGFRITGLASAET